MGSEITIVAPQSIEESERLAARLSKSALIAAELRGKEPDILATILTGAELGLAPMQSLRGIVVIKGKPALSADTMGALVKRRADVCEYLTLVESTPQRATYATRRRGDQQETRLAFSLEDATRAGLAGSDTYRKFPAAMLRARALSAICRAVYPDLVLGLYDPEEAAAIGDDPGSVIAGEVVQPSSASGVEKMRAKLEAVRAKATPPAPVVVDPPKSPPPVERPRVAALVVDAPAAPESKPVPEGGRVRLGPSAGKAIRDLDGPSIAHAIEAHAKKLEALKPSQRPAWLADAQADLAELRAERERRIREAAGGAPPPREPGADDDEVPFGGPTP